MEPESDVQSVQGTEAGADAGTVTHSSFHGKDFGKTSLRVNKIEAKSENGVYRLGSSVTLESP